MATKEIETFIAQCLSTGQYSRKGEVTPSAKTLEKWAGELGGINPNYYRAILELFKLKFITKTWPKNFPEHIKSLALLVKIIEFNIDPIPLVEVVEPKKSWWERVTEKVMVGTSNRI